MCASATSTPSGEPGGAAADEDSAKSCISSWEPLHLRHSCWSMCECASRCHGKRRTASSKRRRVSSRPSCRARPRVTSPAHGVGSSASSSVASSRQSSATFSRRKKSLKASSLTVLARPLPRACHAQSIAYCALDRQRRRLRPAGLGGDPLVDPGAVAGVLAEDAAVEVPVVGVLHVAQELRRRLPVAAFRRRDQPGRLRVALRGVDLEPFDPARRSSPEWPHRNVPSPVAVNGPEL